MTDFDSPPAPVSPPAGSLGALVRPALIVTALSLATQVMTFLMQVVIARLFGATPAVDAYFAAATLPQYVFTILLGSLPMVFIPALGPYLHKGDDGDAARVIRSVSSVFLLATAALTLVALAFASPLIRLMTPGLAPATHALAVQLAWILWPSIVASTAVTLSTSVDHASGRFVRAGLVPLVGIALNLTLIAALGPRFGVIAVSIATTAALLLQMILLLPALRPALRQAVTWNHPAVRDVLVSIGPLLLAGIFIRVNLIGERFFASALPAGSISHVAYASRAISLLSVVIAGGLGTVMFPRMTASLSRQETRAVDAELTVTLRLMLTVIAPIIAIGIPLARPGVAVLFERGRFSANDTAEVSALLAIYLFSLPAAAIGTITGRLLYALRASNLLAIVGSIEGILYVCYTLPLVRRFGVAGVAWGFVIYMTGSLLWQLIAIGRRMEWTGRGQTLLAALRTVIAAAAGGVAAGAVVALVNGSALADLLLGGLAGVVAFAAALAIVNTPDARLVFTAVRRFSSR